MECVIQNEAFVAWLVNYGPIVLFFVLAIGIVAVPIPEETLMVLTGMMMQAETMPVISTVIAAYAGSICGITTSYYIGRTVGIFFVHKYGKWVGLNDIKLAKVHDWFEKWGKWTLPIGYFVPGVRHFTGLIAGTSYLHYRVFALFAYTGALLWVSTFLSIGYFFGTYCMSVINGFEKPGVKLVVGGILLFLAIAFFIYRKWKKS